MKRKFLVLIPLIIIGLGFLSMRFFASFKTEPEKRTPKKIVRFVDVQAVRMGDVEPEIVAYGRLKSAQPVVLYSEVDGTLERGDRPFLPGSSFARNQLLIKVDTRQIVLDLNTAKSELLTALASVLPEIKVDFPEQYRVWDDYFNSCRFDADIPVLPVAANQKIKLYLSRFHVYKLYFSVRDLEILYEKHFFRAPFRGSVVSADFREGSNVRPGSRLGEIISLENLEAEMPVPSGDIHWIDRDKPVVLTSSELEGTWTGRVARVGKTINTRTQTAQIYISLDPAATADLYDGVFMKAVIPGTVIANAVTVPRRALYEDRFVYVLKDGMLEYRMVQIARRESDHVIVNGGLTNGDQLVMDMLQGVTPGMPARAKKPGGSRS